MTDDRVPTKKEWGTCPEHVLDLDWNWSFEHYVGKSNAEVLDYLIKGPLSKAEDLHYMNRLPFRYYVKSYCACLVSRHFNRDDMADAASALFTIIEYKLQHDPSTLLPLHPELMQAANFAANHQDEFEAPRQIYGDFEDRLKDIKRRLIELGG